MAADPALLPHSVRNGFLDLVVCFSLKVQLFDHRLPQAGALHELGAELQLQFIFFGEASELVVELADLVLDLGQKAEGYFVHLPIKLYFEVGGTALAEQLQTSYSDHLLIEFPFQGVLQVMRGHELLPLRRSEEDVLDALAQLLHQGSKLLGCVLTWQSGLLLDLVQVGGHDLQLLNDGAAQVRLLKWHVLH